MEDQRGPGQQTSATAGPLRLDTRTLMPRGALPPLLISPPRQARLAATHRGQRAAADLPSQSPHRRRHVRVRLSQDSGQ